MPTSDVIDLFLATSASKASHPAVSARGQALNYGDFESRVRDFAGAFARCKGPGVLIGLPQGADAYAAMLGAGLAGSYYSPLNIHAPVEKLQRIARVMHPDVIVAEPTLCAALALAAPNAAFIHPHEPLGPPLTGHGNRHEIGYIIFTSGTTGTPKGVVIPRTALNHFIDWVRYTRTVASADRIAQFSNIGFDVSVTDIYGALCVGATLYPAIGRVDRLFPARMVAREKLTVWNSTPSVISLMMQAGEVTTELLGSLSLVNTCGEPLLPIHLEALFTALPDLVVQNSYGPTETTVTMTELRLNRTNFHSACGTSVAIGSPISGMGIYLLGGAHPDEGEIAITGPQLAIGYWMDPKKSAASFRTISVEGKPVRAYFSGDWAERCGDHIFFKERIDHQIKIRGFRLELHEVARAIHDFGFPVVCVLKWQDELAAVIEYHPQRPFNEADLRAALSACLEAHAIPHIIRLIDRMPRTANDKLDRQAVAMWLSNGSHEQAGAPRSRGG